MKNIIKVDVTLTTKTPLSISLPIAKFTKGNKWNNAPMMTRGVDEDGNKKSTCYIPATTIRGSMRRTAVLPRMEAAAEAGKPYDLPRAYMELAGQDSSSEQEIDEIDPMAIRRAREANHIVDFFGSGLGVSSRLKVSNLMPGANVEPDTFTTVKKDLDTTEGVVDLLGDKDRSAFFKRSTANSKRSKADSLVAQLEAKLKKDGSNKETKVALKEAQELTKKYNDDMGDMKVSSKNLPSWHALPAGVEWTGYMIVDRPREGDLEIIQHWLEEISHYPMLGGHQARGCGEIHIRATITVNGEEHSVIDAGGFKKPAITALKSSSAA